MSWWWIVAAGLLVLGVVLLIVYLAELRWYCYDWVLLVAVCCVIAGVFALIICAASTHNAQKKVHLFEETKAFLESYEPADAVENASITETVVVLNGWLYSAQYDVEHWPRWTFYDEAVLDLEPIARK